MVVLLVLAAAHAGLWRLHRARAQQLMAITALVTVVTAFWAGAAQLELAAQRMTTYGSDAELYWQESQALARGVVNVEGLMSAPALITLHALVLRTAPGVAWEWILATQVALTSLCANLLFAVLAERVPAVARGGWGPLLLFVALFVNGIVLWVPVRGVKEMYLLAMLAALPWAFEVGRAHRHPVTWAALAGVVAFASRELGLLRPGLQYAAVPMAFGAAVSVVARRPAAVGRRRRRWGPVVALAGVSVVLVGAVALVLRTQLERLALYVIGYARLARQGDGGAGGEQASFALTPLDLATGTLRFVLGPGPIRSFRQLLYSDVFVAFTKVGDVLVLLGAAQWWITLAATVYVLARRRRVRPLLLGADYLLVASVHVASYVFVYAGSGDTRHRAVLYVLAIPSMMALFLDAGGPAAPGATRARRGPLAAPAPLPQAG